MLHYQQMNLDVIDRLIAEAKSRTKKIDVTTYSLESGRLHVHNVEVTNGATRHRQTQLGARRYQLREIDTPVCVAIVMLD